MWTATGSFQTCGVGWGKVQVLDDGKYLVCAFTLSPLTSSHDVLLHGWLRPFDRRQLLLICKTFARRWEAGPWYLKKCSHAKK